MPQNNQGGIYQMFKALGMQPALGGCGQKPEMMSRSAWTCYIKVDAVDDAIAAIEAAGGKVLNGPMEVPGGDRVAQCVDPQGATFAIDGK